MRTRPDEFYRQSAVVPFRLRKKHLEVMLVSTRKGKRWTIPKGIVEDDMTPLESACKEAEEEAGIIGRPVEKRLGTYHRQKWGDTSTIEVFPLEVTEILDEWPEDFRQRCWVASADVVELTEDPGLESIMTSLEEFVESDR